MKCMLLAYHRDAIEEGYKDSGGCPLGHSHCASKIGLLHNDNTVPVVESSASVMCRMRDIAE